MVQPRKYFTTPIYYVNDRPHIGHAYCSVLTDAFTRFGQLFGSETYFLTGVDEHGQKVQKAAENRGISPKDHVDELQDAFRSLLPELHVANNDFIRTTEERHTKVVRRALQELYDKGDIYQSTYEGWYSERAERFWTEKDLVDGACPDTGGPVERVQEQNYFFKMSKYQQQLIDHMEANKDWIVPKSRWQEVRSFLKQPLLDLSISRPVERLSWGIPLPFDEQCVTYVWFDALLNYVSGIGKYSDEERFEKWWPHAHHFIGKDILTTHAVYWGTMLLAMGLPLPKQICATGWWLIDNTKMSKSLGNVVDPLSLKDKYGPEVLRYFLMRDMAVGQDASFSEEAVVRRNNSDLSNDLGNLVRRTLALVRKGFDGSTPPQGPAGPMDKDVQERAAALPAKVGSLLDAYRMHEAIEECLQMVRFLNKYIDHTAPFKVVKEDPARAGEILRNILEGLCVVGTLLHPIMPKKMDQLLERIGAGTRVNTIQDLSSPMLQAGAKIGAGDPIFPRHEFTPPAADEQPVKKAKKGKKANKKEPQTSNEGDIAFGDFAKLDLRCATILEAENVQGSKKLIKLTVDVGEESTRTVVSGIADSYQASDLPGTKILLVANLAPKKIFGILSHGMALLAETEEGLCFVSAQSDVPPGTPVR